MEKDLPIQEGIVIPGHELEITASRSGGHGGQHVYKTSTKILVRWNIHKTTALTDEQKELVLEKLYTHITHEGDLLVQNSETRSQHQNKELALAHLAQEVRKALYVPKMRMKTKVPRATKEERLYKKSVRSLIKQLRSKKIQED